MKKMLLKLIISLFIISLFFGAIASAVENVTTPIDVINRYRPNTETKYSIVSEKKLFNLEGNEIYTYYELDPYGYAILYNDTSGLMEACYSQSAYAPIDPESDISYYYGGPGIYCVIQDGEFINTLNGTLLNEDMISDSITSERLAREYEAQKFHIERQVSENLMNTWSLNEIECTASVEYNYFSNLIEYGTNTNGTCTIIAAAMLLGYYDSFINDGIISTQYENNGGTTESFHQLLNNYVYGTEDQSAIFIHEAALGINQYLSDNMMSCILLSENASASAVRSKIITELELGNPVIASFNNTQYNHSVLVYSVTYDTADPEATAVFTVNMGWHSGTSDEQSWTEYVLSAGWFYECGYIESTCENHSYRMWYDYDAYMHRRSCSWCVSVESEEHSLYWDATIGECTRCGRTDPIGALRSYIADIAATE